MPCSSILTNWQFQLLTNDTSLPIASNTLYNATVSTTGHQIHSDLQFNNLVPDLFHDDNEVSLQWISNATWKYRAVFDGCANDDAATNSSAHLIFEGLDAIARVTLNDNDSILNSSNAFHRHVVPLPQPQSPHVLSIEFESGWQHGKKLEREWGRKECWNGDCSRVYSRKPAYQYGWDWGPTYLTLGPWRPVTLVCGDFIEDFFVKYDLNEEMTEAKLTFEIRARLAKPRTRGARIVIYDPRGVEVDVIPIEQVKVDDFCVVEYLLHDVELWYPYKFGVPTLYTFEMYFDYDDDSVLMSVEKIGFRKVELVQTQDEFGESFYFKVNGVAIQMLGSNWVPQHSFHSTVKPVDYANILRRVVDSNQNMIRVWGGGQYENDEFYSLCDELGIMIWQDFMFACAIYPSAPIVNSVEKEVRDQLQRLRRYASIVIYAGNNEDYQIADALKLDQSNITQFPARVIYEKVIPEAIHKLANQVIYRYGSPYSDPSHSSYDVSIGDSHQWLVWHGPRLPYQEWPQLSGRFVSEFGMLAFPSYNTLASHISPDQLYFNSTMVNFHNKAMNGVVNSKHYVEQNIHIPSNCTLERWVYLTQLMQSEAISLAFRVWRRKWHKREVGGILVWQLNDCWPAISWSIIGYGNVPKLSYYGVRRESADFAIAGYVYSKPRRRHGEKAQVVLKEEEEEEEEEEWELDVWGFGVGCNMTLAIRAYNSTTGHVTDSSTTPRLNFSFNKVNSILTGYTPHWLKKATIVELRLFHADGTLAAGSSIWPQPLKSIDWVSLNKDLSLGMEVVRRRNDTLIILSTNKPVKGLEVYVPGRDLEISDNGIDLFPGDNQTLVIGNLQEKDRSGIRYRHL
ncbi:uncharacterized protein LODBEIA_P09870 [Lodderomyces beijingensis]|uniref:beta-mannosidase n=1 Tax=Lodderomyces beijingensis TaxID=1775926 RepID=A0ABP0ZF30_9ASCO